VSGIFFKLACPVWIYTQSNITSIVYKLVSMIVVNLKKALENTPSISSILLLTPA
jgi:hypothetical protein